nr:HEAT repeat domain-containing protein [Synechococcus elongatus]
MGQTLDVTEEAARMNAIAGVVGLAIGAGGAYAILWPRLKKAETSRQQLSQDLQRQDKRLNDELNAQGQRHHEAVQDLKAQISNLESALATAQGDLSTLETQKRELEAQLSGLQTSLAAAESQHQTELASRTATIHALETQISQQREQILALQQCTHNLEQRLAQTLNAGARTQPPTTAAEPSTIVESTSSGGTTLLTSESSILPSTSGIVLEDLLQQARDRDEQTRANTAFALGAIASASAASQVAAIVRALAELGRDPSATVRLAVVEALSDWRSPKVLPLLRQALRDTDPTVVKAANAGLTPFRGALRKAKATKKKSRSRRSAR